MNGLLTQVARRHRSPANRTAQRSPSSTASEASEEASSPQAQSPTAASGSKKTLQRSSRGGYVDTARLAMLRRQPKNISPASELHLDHLLPPQLPEKTGKVTLLLDIDETLVHASFNAANPFDVRLTIETPHERGYIYVAFRPKLKEFLQFVAPRFEVAVFTASQSCYADQLMDYIDPKGELGKLRLFREHCTELRNGRVKDLSLIGRPLNRVAIIDNSPVAYLFQPRNAIPIVSWFEDTKDKEFERLIPMLADLAVCESVYDVLDEHNSTVQI